MVSKPKSHIHDKKSPSQLPSDLIADQQKFQENLEDQHFNHPRSQRMDTRPAYGEGKVCNHVSAQFWMKRLNEQAVTLEDHVKVLPMPEATSTELTIAEHWGYKNYQFKFPKRYFPIQKTTELLNLTTGLIEENIKLCSYPHALNKTQAFVFPGNKRQKAELRVRWTQYCAAIDLPKDFRLKYPYLYAVLQDMFITRIIAVRNNRKLKIAFKMIGLVMQYQGQLIHRLYDLLAGIPNVDQYFKNHPDKMAELKEIEQGMDQVSIDAEDPDSIRRFKALIDVKTYLKEETKWQHRKKLEARKKRGMVMLTDEAFAQLEQKKLT